MATLTTNKNYLSPTGFHLKINSLRFPNLEYFATTITLPQITLEEQALPYKTVDYAAPGTRLTFSDLSITAQLGIIVTATLASIGAAAVPSAGIIVLVIVLAQAGIPEAGLALIFAVDRPLDMCRTVVNITGDATVSMIVDKIVSKK